MDSSSSTFTQDVTPLILAAHKNNYEIIKILLERGCTLPTPHNIKCGCDECVASIQKDSLRHSQARINSYKALTAPSLISLSSADPLLTAFELSWDLRRLSRAETEFRAEYNEMRQKVENFATSLLDHVRTSDELMVMLNYDHKNPHWVSGDRQTLERLKLAIKYKQKKFVAHPNVQQLLAAIWYEGVPGFRRKNIFGQSLQIIKFSLAFPFYCTIYMVAPTSRRAVFMKRPFIKFICHSSSYLFFLGLLGLSSQRIEISVLEWIDDEWAKALVSEWRNKERGAQLSFTEYGVTIYVISLICEELRQLWSNGLEDYIYDLWNLVDFVMITFYVLWLSLRMSSLYIAWKIEINGGDPYAPREQWNSFEPMLISEGAFAAAMIFSFLKLVHIFSVNPYLGPLQISLGRMIIDIAKFFFIYTLVLFAFGCGLCQLLCYYAELEKNKCYHLNNGQPDFEHQDRACTVWRRYANLFETSQSLFWASFGLIDLMTFELTGIKPFTRFWAMLMFGSYSVINIIVLLNMLIAMMANSYQIISERADVEWKFARSRLWMSYFDEDDVLPPPFNIFPNVQMFSKLFSHCHRNKNVSVDCSFVKDKHNSVTKSLIKRYIMAEQQKRNEFGITEDDVIEIRQDISTLRYELIDIFRQNGMTTPSTSFEDKKLSGRKGKIMERRILANFSIGNVEGFIDELNKVQPTHVSNILDHMVNKFKYKSHYSIRKRKDWNALARAVSFSDHIGSARRATLKKKELILSKSFPAESTGVYNSSDGLDPLAKENQNNEKQQNISIPPADPEEWF